MTIHELSGTPPADLARSLADFETRFIYPLGVSRHFRISHGEDYPRFFRAIGDARTFVAVEACRVLGALSVAICRLNCADGSVRQAAYIGDLKVDPTARVSRAFIRLVGTADDWARPQVTAAFGVVMDGTRATPTAYTGRAGVETFCELGKLCILRFSTKPMEADQIGEWHCEPSRGFKCYRKLSAGRFFTDGGVAETRSESAPLWLAASDDSACGRLEDTRRAKRLFDSDNQEIQSAHLGCFAFSDPAVGAELIRVGCHQAAARGFPALFVAIDQADLPRLEPHLGNLEKVVAPATIYGAGLPRGASWNINTSEI